ncbi:hypothetical protein [Streptomyces sp. 8N616]|uniref:hypothetical protein n=1 Tax=Streptomyces sp. 8N616 TaxID=3457414 RepID=UPI003FD16562
MDTSVVTRKTQDTPPAQAPPLAAAIGEAFARALSEGLSRAAGGRSRTMARARTETLSRAARERPRTAAAPNTGREPQASPAARRLLRLHAASIERRFASSLPTILDPPDGPDTSLRTALIARTRRIVTAATAADGQPAPRAPAAEGIRIGPYRAAASTLLMECVMLQFLESGGHGAAAARLQAEAVRAVGHSVRRADATVPAAGSHANCCWQESHGVVRDLHDHLGRTLGTAARLLEPSAQTDS